MADIIKKNMTEIWASAGDVQAPEDSKIRTGWVVESVPRQWWNWFENRQDNNIAYLLQKGITEWDAETEYQTNKSFVQRNGVVYKSVAASVNKDPATNPANWVKAFLDSTPYLERIKNLPLVGNTIPALASDGTASSLSFTPLTANFLQQPTQATARQAIDAQQANANLTSLAGVTPNTNGLPYFSSTNAMSITALTSFGRSIIAQNDASGARGTLGLGTAATQNVQTVPWSTFGLLGPNAFGLGGYSLIANANSTNVNDPNCPTGFYDVAPDSLAGFIAPVPSTWTRIIHQCHSNAAGFATQIATGNFANPGQARIFVRKAAGTGWGDWVELMNSSTYPAQTSQTNDAGNTSAAAGGGKLLRTGAFGIGARLDLRDTVWSTGLPSQLQGTGTVKGFASGGQLGVPNYATGDLGVLTVDAHWTDASGIRGYMRTFSDGASMFIQPSGATLDSNWGAWRQVYTTSNTQAITDQVIQSIQPTLNAKQDALGFVPVRQGAGTGQLNNPVSIGWSAQSRLRLQVDTVDMGSQWPIDCLNSLTTGRWSTARTLTLNGDVTGSVSWDGSADVAMNVQVGDDSHFHSISTVSGLQAALSARTPNSQLNYFTAAQSALEGPGPSGQVVFSVTQEQAGNGFSPGCTFLRPGFYGVNLGLNNQDNNLRIGGYSMGAVSYPILHTGNAASLGFGGTSGALGASGWTRLGNGLIIQWGSFTGNGNIPFPTAFPSACTSVAQMQSGALSGNVQRIALNGNPGNTSFNVTGVDPSFNLPARWIALGY